ncbi:MAG: hypothetical protein WKF75_09445 [Singulisphaera sp.]
MQGTVLFGARLAPERVESVLEHVAEGCGVRQTGRLFKVNRKTVGRLSRLAGEHARDLHDEPGRDSPSRARSSSMRSGPSSPKEKEKEKEKDCDPLDPADDPKGDTWDHVAFDPESRLVVSVVPGERSAENGTANDRRLVGIVPGPQGGHHHGQQDQRDGRVRRQTGDHHAGAAADPPDPGDPHPQAGVE